MIFMENYLRKRKGILFIYIWNINLIIRDSEADFAFDQSDILYKELEKQEKLLKEVETSYLVEKKSNLTRDKVNRLNSNKQNSDIQIDTFSSASLKTNLFETSFSSTFAAASKITYDNVIYQRYV